MSDIYNLLSKYFDGESSKEEDQLVQQFKRDNPEEYNNLQSFWTQKGIDFKEFDSAKALDEIIQKTAQPKRRNLQPFLKYAVSIAAAFLLLFGGVYLFNVNQVDTLLVQIRAKDHQQKIELEDGSIVYLNANASFSYPESFQPQKRIVTLQGEAFFEIAKDANRPFIVNTNHSEVTVLGTSFNINTTSDQTEVSVATGKVQVNSLTNKESSILLPNQTALNTKTSMKVFPTKNTNYLAWKTGVFVFEKTTIQQVVKELKTVYKKQIKLTKLDADCLLTSTFDKQDIKEIVEIIQLSCDMKLRQKNKSYELY